MTVRSAARPLTIEMTRLLIVEGKDEETFFPVLYQTLNCKEPIQIIGMEGKDRLAERLHALTLASKFVNVTHVGIVRDADSDPRAAFQSVRHALRHADLPVPRGPGKAATREGKPVCSVQILPGNHQTGTLEDLCLQSVMDPRPMPCVDAFFDCLRASQLDVSRDFSKRRCQVYLSSLDECVREPGRAAQKDYWNFDHPSFEELRTFLRGIGGG